MKSYLRALFAASLCLVLLPVLAACQTVSAITSIPASPAAAADTTVIDEKAAIAVEASWKAAGALIEAGVDAGLIKAAAARRVEQLDAAAERWVRAVRAAYDTGNAPGYIDALGKARAAVTALTDAIAASGVPAAPRPAGDR